MWPTQPSEYKNSLPKSQTSFSIFINTEQNEEFPYRLLLGQSAKRTSNSGNRLQNILPNITLFSPFKCQTRESWNNSGVNVTKKKVGMRQNRWQNVHMLQQIIIRLIGVNKELGMRNTGMVPGYALFKQINCFMKFVPQMGERKTRINKRVIHALETYKGFCMTYCTKGHVTKCLLPFFVQFSVVFFWLGALESIRGLRIDTF